MPSPTRKSTPKAPRHVALLRGINVGGKNKMPMAELRELLAEVGCEDILTYIQSGNVVFSASPRTAATIARKLRGSIEERFGFRVPVVLRSADELHDVARRNPFLAQGCAPGALHVAFLEKAPSRAQAARLDPERSPGDAFVLRGSELYLHLPNGVARTRLTNAWLDSTLQTTSTIRNWRTVLQLDEMAGA